MYIVLQGLDWLLRMYTVGACPDYRWTYDACSPSATQLVAELDSAARLVKAGTDVPQLGAEEDPVRPTPCLVGISKGGHQQQICHMKQSGDSPRRNQSLALAQASA